MPARRLDLRALPSDNPVRRWLDESAVSTRAPVQIEHDGNRLDAREGEPLAVSLLAAGRATLSRSVKFHRPRGAACFRGSCEGCLSRVDGIPNVMTCMVRTRDGNTVHSQNAFPSASFDVFRVTDWFFPRMFDHHHLMVGFGSAANRTMQVIARRMAGLGTLPDQTPTASDAYRSFRLSADVLVVGAGIAGLVAATQLARGGHSVILVEDDAEPGGVLLDLPAWPTELLAATVSPRRVAERLASAARAAGVRLIPGTHVSATFDDTTLAVNPVERVSYVLEARARVFANGTHEQMGLFSGNDLPGIFTARGACRTLCQGVLVGERPIVIGNSVTALSIARAFKLCNVPVLHLPEGVVDQVLGNHGVKAVQLRATPTDELRRERCDALILGEVPTPSFELTGETGATIDGNDALGVFVPRLRTGSHSHTDKDGVFVTGTVTGMTSPVWSTLDIETLDTLEGVAPSARACAREVAGWLDTRRETT